MPSPTTGGASASAPRRRKKACQRCKTRKQRCDYQEPACHNCASAGVECVPVVHEALEQYPAGYVQSLERHAAALERTLNEQLPGSAPDHLHGVQAEYLGLDLNQTPPNIPDQDQYQIPHMPSLPEFQPHDDISHVLQDARVALDLSIQTHSSPIDATALAISPTLRLTEPAMPQILGSHTQPELIPTATAASFFRTYFYAIHPQYPFLSVKDCGDWYNEWKTAPAQTPIRGWPAFFVKMIFAIGSLIQSRSDEAPRYQHQSLRAQAQAEQNIVADSKSTSLIRMQAMLLSAMLALHSESTSRITHISGAIMRFASIHGYHLLTNNGNEESLLKIKVWSCAYILDRAVSGVLDILVSLPDAYVSTPLYEEVVEPIYPMPWLADCPAADPSQIVPNHSTFAHICRIRLIQSCIMHAMHAVRENTATNQWHESMRAEIDNWARSEEIYTHSLVNNEGYQSPLWLQLISQLSRLILCRPTRSNIHSTVADVALKASCDACTIFRAIQKKRQIAQPWLVVITQFQAGVTLYYVTWARGVEMPRDVYGASRDCTAVLTIFADRWRNAEHYRDCLEVLARTIPRTSPPGHLDRQDRDELARLTSKVEEVGIHRHVSRMLWEMCAGNESDYMQI